MDPSDAYHPFFGQVQVGKKYPNSVVSKEADTRVTGSSERPTDNKKLVILQYAFKPKNVDKLSQGLLKIPTGKQGDACVRMTVGQPGTPSKGESEHTFCSTSVEPKSCNFKGVAMDSKSIEHEYILRFHRGGTEGGSFTLNKCDQYIMQLKPSEQEESKIEPVDPVPGFSGDGLTAERASTATAKIARVTASEEARKMLVSRQLPQHLQRKRKMPTAAAPSQVPVAKRTSVSVTEAEEAASSSRSSSSSS